MRRLVAGALVVLGLAGLAWLPGTASADGTLDPEFNGTGQIGIDAVPQYSEYVEDMAIDSQGRILVLEIGTYNPTGYQAAFVVRFLEDGTIDQSFSVGDDSYGNGVKAIGQVESLTLNAIQIDAQGRIVLVGGVEAGPVDWDVFMARLLPDGAYDTSFGEGGVLSQDLNGGSYDRAYGLSIDSLGRMVVNGGYQPVSTAPKGFVARFTQDGDFDPSFGNGQGWMVPFASPTNSTGVSDVVLLPDGKLLVAGTRGAISDFSVLRLQQNGAIDTSFGQGGLSAASFENTERQGIVDLELDAEGRILAVGRLQRQVPESTGSIGIVRLSPGGSIDTGYGTGGKSEFTLGAETGANAAAIDKIGRLVIAGDVTDDGYAHVDGFMTRVGPDGKLDTSFGQNGYIREIRPGTRNYFGSLVMDPRDRILVGGYQRPADNIFALAMSRYTVTFPSPPPPTPPTTPPTSLKLKAGKPKLNKKKGIALIPITVNVAARITLSGKNLKKKSAVTKGAKTVRVAVIPVRKLKKSLRKKGKAAAKVKITARPTAGGATRKVTKKVTLRLTKKSR